MILFYFRCIGSPGNLKCQCKLGWKGDSCSVTTIPTSFQARSFVTLALSFSPLRFTSSIELR